MVSGEAAVETRRPRFGVRWLGLIGLLIVLGGAGAVAWHKVLRDRFFPRNFGTVVEGRIYRSARLTDPMVRHVVESKHLKTILDLGAYEPDSEREAEMRAMAEELGVRRFRFSLIGDGTGNPNYYVQALRLMQDDRALPMLVMCGAGAQRTGACVLLYRTLVEGKTIQESYAETFRYKHDPGDDWIMLAYVADWNDEIRRSLESGEPIPGFDPVPYPLGE
ncbi:MAG: hypothetical protein H6811_04520 [Phycisphaeraceae bacterium]|nr:hypothetical protein [Phycisphaeraceae bacterium]